MSEGAFDAYRTCEMSEVAAGDAAAALDETQIEEDEEEEEEDADDMETDDQVLCGLAYGVERFLVNELVF